MNLIGVADLNANVRHLQRCNTFNLATLTVEAERVEMFLIPLALKQVGEGDLCAIVGRFSK